MGSLYCQWSSSAVHRSSSSSLGRMWPSRPVWRLPVCNKQRQDGSGRSGSGNA
jgi:hypothetical protein